MKYAGIGSRKAEKNRVLIHRMIDIGRILAKEGWMLRSGGADGADTAFERGCDQSNGKKEIFLPWEGFNGHISSLFTPTKEAFDVARQVVPWWKSLSQGKRKMHARNAHQVFGYTMRDPVDVVICWTPKGELVGGTATAMKIAINNNIPIINLADGIDDWHQDLKILKLLGG